jgi:hypothetical protein
VLAIIAKLLFLTDGHTGGRRLQVKTVESTIGALAVGNERPPIVNFLFLAADKVNNLRVWNSFFATAPRDHYRAYVHCKTMECLSSVSGSVLIPVSMVPSYYCADLVSPMNHLLSEALLASPGTNPADKFVFVSDSTLPAKPFAHIYISLSQRSGSDFCVCSMKEWALRKAQPAIGNTNAADELAVKHHQWSVLERSHAERVVQVWKSGSPLVNDFLLRFQMNLPPRSRSVKTFSGTGAGCLDEFYHMAALFGTLKYSGAKPNSTVDLPAFTNSPLQILPEADLQGSCDTFVAWPDFANTSSAGGNNAFKRLYANLDPLSQPYNGNSMKPGYWDAISSHGIKAIRDSEFFFARKFTDNPRVLDGGDFVSLYTRLVLG